MHARMQALAYTHSHTQRFIDLDKIVSVHEVSPAQQDKNHATFLVQCDGRTFQLQSQDEASMGKWVRSCVSACMGRSLIVPRDKVYVYFLRSYTCTYLYSAIWYLMGLVRVSIMGKSNWARPIMTVWSTVLAGKFPLSTEDNCDRVPLL